MVAAKRQLCLNLGQDRNCLTIRRPLANGRASRGVTRVYLAFLHEIEQFNGLRPAQPNKEQRSKNYMANTPQARKRIRRNQRRAVINGNRMSRIRTFVKQVEAAIDGGDKAAAAEALKAAQPELARGVARGVLHKNTVARKLSRLTKRVAAL